MKIAVLNDDAPQAALICQSLAAAGHLCQSYASGAELLPHLRPETMALLVIDWQIGDASAAAVLAAARQELGSDFPVLFLCLCSAADQIDAGLAGGASDYQLKPLRRAELVTRVEALLRRAYPQQEAEAPLQFGAFQFDLRHGRILRHGAALEVTRKEFELALLFFRHLGRPLSRTTILDAVWAREPDLPSRTMDTHVSRVRNKLLLRPEHGFRLAPVYSYGYRLEQTESV